jgi:hypothetical protein
VDKGTFRVSTDMFFPFGQVSLTVYHLRMTGVKFARIWTSRCRDIEAEAGLHALMHVVRKDVASEKYFLDSRTRGNNCAVQKKTKKTKIGPMTVVLTLSFLS